MDTRDYRHWARRAVDWGADYLATLRDRPVRAQVRPGDVKARIADAPPRPARRCRASSPISNASSPAP